MGVGDDGWDYGLFRTNLELGAFDSDLLIEQREMARVARHLLDRVESAEGAWMVHDYGLSAYPFPTEIEALRFAQEKNESGSYGSTMRVTFVKWGESAQ